MYRSSVGIVEDYTPLFMHQLGYSATMIGIVPLLGLVTQSIGIPLLSYIADKFRARKLILFLSISLTAPICLLLLVPPTPEALCAERTCALNNSCNIINNINNTTTHHYSTKVNNTANYDHYTKNNSAVALREVLSRHKIAFIVASDSKSQRSETDVDLRNENDDETYSKNISEPQPSESDVAMTRDEQYRLQYFFIFMGLRGIFELFKRLTWTLITVATLTHLQENKNKFGYYACWGDFGSGLSLFVVGILLAYVEHVVCGVLVPDYALVYIYAAVLQALALISLPWMKFDYLQHRVVDYAEVKATLTKPHYILMLVISCHAGLCTAFQSRWEFWYMQQLGGSSIVMAVTGLVRKPFVGFYFIFTGPIIHRFGELTTLAVSLFIFAASFGGLAFIRNAWLVIPIDSVQAVAYVFSYSSLIIHFSKAGTKASSTFIQGMLSLTYDSVGKELGTAITGYFLTSQGITITLCGYSLVTFAFGIIITIYILTAKDLDGYTQLSTMDDEDDESR